MVDFNELQPKGETMMILSQKNKDLFREGMERASELFESRGIEITKNELILSIENVYKGTAPEIQDFLLGFFCKYMTLASELREE